MEIPSKYVMPCKNGGRCREIALKEHGISVPTPIGSYGLNFIEFVPGDIKSRVQFRCCVGCKQPVDSAEAAWLNDQIGLELPTMDSIRERLAKIRKNHGKK